MHGRHSRLIVTTAEAAIDAAVAGVGLTRVLSYQAARALRAGSLALALEQFEPMPWVNLIYSGGRMLPLKLRAFLDFAAPRLKLTLSDSSGSSRPGGDVPLLAGAAATRETAHRSCSDLS